MGESFWYPSVEDVLTIHDDIVSEYSYTESGVQRRGDISFAIEFIKEGGVGPTPDTIHEKASHLLRLLVANHPFVDANKRTALNTVVVFYFLNGYRFEYGDEIRVLLKRLGTDEESVELEEIRTYLNSNTEEVEIVDEIDEWRDELIEYGLDQLVGDSSNPND